MGAGHSTPEVKKPMRCRSEKQVPKCFRHVKCPYPQASVAHGTYGVINYSLVGPPTGELVVCLHGLNGSRSMFQDLAEFISKQAGYQVLSFDLYGHGLSNAPKVDMCPCAGAHECSRRCTCGMPRARYDLDFFVDQARELLDLLGFPPDAPVNLVGFSLGGTIAVAFSHKYPSRVRRLVAMSPAGFLPKVPLSYYLLKATWCWLIPLAPHVLCTCLYRRDRFAKSMRKEGTEDEAVIESMWARFVWQLYVKRGVASATLAVCHRIPWFSLKNLFVEAGRHSRPVLLIWGDKDNLNPASTVAQDVKACFSNAQLLVVKNAGHIAMGDRPRQVIMSVLSFLLLPVDTCMETAQIQAAVSLRPVRRSRRPLHCAPSVRSGRRGSIATPRAALRQRRTRKFGEVCWPAQTWRPGTRCPRRVPRTPTGRRRCRCP